MSARQITGFFLLLALAASASVLWGQPAPATPTPALPLTLEGYQAELERCSQAVAQLIDDPQQASTLQASLPRAWLVSAQGERFDISTAWLGEALGHLPAQADKRASQIHAIQAHLTALRQGAQDYAVPGSYGDARRQLTSILGRREFRGVGPPSWVDLWKRRVIRWILRALDSVFRTVGQHPGAGELLVWLLIVGAVMLLGIVAVRVLLRPAPPPVSMPTPTPMARRDWSDWLREARTAAQHRDYRDALHRTYWAAISRFEEMGTWRPDRARTPREYLRLLPDKDPNRPPFSALTRRFEVTWYGHDVATSADFDAALAQLERLGCRVR